ncbi:MAG: hypothetical protein ONA69_09105, partial [candidate division KSB1 bacterium]|nr:hypothetical protein [candidate division KSB1 bacterium]
FGSAINLASFLNFIYSIFLGRRDAKFAQVKDAPWNQKAAMVLLSLLCIFFGLFAWAVPLRGFIVPAVAGAGFSLEWLGDYHPLRFLGLFLVIFAMGFALFWAIRRVRYDDLYLGGMSPEARFRFIGTAFYKEIREMTPLKQIYQAAENKWFDVYDLGSKAVLAVAGWTQKAHPGWLPLYVLMIIAGLLALLILL